MSQLALEFLLALAVSLGLVPICREVSRRMGKVAQPREDRWHKRPVALFGGVAIGLTLFGSAAGFGLFTEVPALLIWGIVIFGAGLVDDLITLKPSTKLVVQFAAACALLFFGYRLYWLRSITLDSLLTLIWVVGVTNAFNLLDNMDGLCAGIALIVGATLFIDLTTHAGAGGPAAEAQYLAILGGATLGFLVYNFHPASIFMGDSGSLLLGFSFAALTLTSAHQAAHRSNLLSVVAAPVFVLLIPIFDTTLVTVLRKLSGRAASSGGRDHSSHRLVAIGLSEKAAVMVLWLLAAIGGAVALAINVISQSWAALASGVFVVAIMLIAIYLSRIRVYEGEDVKLLREGTVTPLVVDFMYKRRVAEVLLDFFLIAIAYSAAYRFRFENEDFLANFGSFRNSLPVVVSVQMVVFFVVGVYRGVWRHFGLNDAVVVAKGIVVGTALSQLIVLYSPRFIGYSRTVFAIYALLLMAFITASRASFRLIGEFVQRQRPTGQRAVIYGAGDGGTFAVRELLSRREPVRILGFVDDDPHKIGSRVQGFRVLGGIDKLIQELEAGGVDLVIVSSNHIAADRIRSVASVCASREIALSRLRVGLEDLVVADGREDAEAAAGGAAGKKLPFRVIKN
jgi:UDP-GlcNAc:undecaprenyl-phosphate GlcNAc-1-phosphate transferase